MAFAQTSGVASAFPPSPSSWTELVRLRHEVEALRRHCADLERHLAIDPLTGLLTRPQFDARLSYEWKRSAAPLSVVVFIVDAPSDDLRATLGRCLHLHLDDVDFGCELSAGSFAALLVDCPRPRAEVVATRLHEGLAETAQLTDPDLTITVGIASSIDDAKTAHDVLTVADRRANAQHQASLHPPPSSEPTEVRVGDTIPAPPPDTL
ncbi:MAG: hypothetical protein AAGA56_25730 [Myxococcota bacterium]